MISTDERLRAYSPDFTDANIERVSIVAGQQADVSWRDYIEKCNIPDPIVYFIDGYKPGEVIDVIPAKGYDGVNVYREAHGNYLSPDTQVTLATLSQVEPTKRHIFFGSPGGLPNRSDKVSLKHLKQVWHGDLSHVVEPLLRYLAANNIEQCNAVGYSGSAEQVPTLVRQAALYGVDVEHAVMIDPVSAKSRGLLKLAWDFSKTKKHFETYCHATNSQPYLEAILEDGSMTEYIAGILSLSNLAIAHAMTKGLQERTHDTLSNRPNTNAHFIWGDESELAIHALMKSMTEELQGLFPRRVTARPLAEQKHAFATDIHLLALIVLESTQQAESTPQAA